MNSNGIEQLVYALTGERVSYSRNQENIYLSCPLAEWTHQSGQDNSRGFSIKINPFGASPCFCWNPKCGFRGTLYQLLTKFEEHSNCVNELARDIYRINSELDPGDLLDMLQDTSIEGPAVLEKSLLDAYPSFREPWRELNEETLSRWDVRFDEYKNRVLFPVYSREGSLVGAVGRTINGHKLKYLNYWGFKKSKVLFGESIDSGSHVVILEGQVDTLRVWQALQGKYSTVALMGSRASKEQLHRIRSYFNAATIFLDNDLAGITGSRHLIEGLIGEIELFHVNKPYIGDPGALSSEQIVSLVTNAVPIELELA